MRRAVRGKTGKSLGPRDAVGREVVANLEGSDRRDEARTHVAVERAVVEPRAGKQVLKRGDVEAEVAGNDRARPEEGRPERAREPCASAVSIGPVIGR